MLTDAEKADGLAAYEAWRDRPPLILAMATDDHLAAMRRRHDAGQLDLARLCGHPHPNNPAVRCQLRRHDATTLHDSTPAHLRRTPTHC